MQIAATIPVYTANQLEPTVSGLCNSWWSCQAVDILSAGFWLVTTGAFTVAVIAVVAIIQSARSAVSEERSRTAAEEKAFLSFARRVSTIPCSYEPVMDSMANGGVLSLSASQPRNSLDDIRHAYRDTVMSTSHYDTEYGESLVENMSIEFGLDIAETVANGAEYSPLLQDLLISKAKQAAADRNRLLNSLILEAGSLRAAENTLKPIDEGLNEYGIENIRKEPYPCLLKRWEDLEALENACSTVLKERQEHVTAEPFSGLDDDPGIFDFLYDSLSVNYPVLVSGTSILERIDKARRNIVRTAFKRI